MFTEQDKLMHKGLMKLLSEGTFPLQAKEVTPFLVVYNWTKDLVNQKVPAKKKGKKK